MSGSRAITARVLCVEDDADTRELISLFLGTQGIDVVTVPNAIDALRVAQDQSFDLYIVDNCMAGRSGIELTRNIRQFDPQTPVLFYSGAADSEQQLAFAAGAQSYLRKPAGIDELFNEVIRLICEYRGAKGES